jgi:purine-binding chemotaxis protein CheW
VDLEPLHIFYEEIEGMDLKNIFNVGYQGFPDGSVSFFSDRIVELVGYQKEEFNNKSINWIRDVMYQEDSPQALEALKKGLKGDKTYTRSYRIRTKSGTLKWIIELSQIICNSEGRIDSINGTLIDITDEKDREKEEERVKRLTGKYLLVSLNGQQYGIPIVKIKEIIRMVSVTTVPNAPHYVRGLISLRGNMVPVIDLCLRLNMESSDNASRACIIVVEIECGAKVVTVGIVVDSVSEAVNIDGTQIEDKVDSIIEGDNQCLLGIAKLQDRTHILLDIDRLFSADELACMSA